MIMLFSLVFYSPSSMMSMYDYNDKSFYFFM